MMVLSLCAIVSTVQSLNWERIVRWIKSSVSRSTAAVASSRTNTLVLRSSARPRHTNCLWPTLHRTIYKLKQTFFSTQEILWYYQWHLTVNSCAIPKIVATLCDLMMQAQVQSLDKVFEVSQLQRCPHSFIRLFVEGVKVHPQCTREQHWVLPTSTQVYIWESVFWARFLVYLSRFSAPA